MASSGGAISPTDRVGDFLPQIELALFAHETRLAEAALSQDLGEFRRIELAGRALEHRVHENLGGDGGIGNREAELAGLAVERGVRDKLAKHLPVETHRARLIVCDRAARLLLQVLQLGLVLLAQFVGRHHGVADLRHLARAIADENVADAPDRETEADEPHHDAHDDPSHESLGHSAHAVEHMIPSLVAALAAVNSARTIGRRPRGRNA